MYAWSNWPNPPIKTLSDSRHNRALVYLSGMLYCTAAELHFRNITPATFHTVGWGRDSSTISTESYQLNTLVVSVNGLSLFPIPSKNFDWTRTSKLQTSISSCRRWWVNEELIASGWGRTKEGLHRWQSIETVLFTHQRRGCKTWQLFDPVLNAAHVLAVESTLRMMTVYRESPKNLKV